MTARTTARTVEGASTRIGGDGAGVDGDGGSVGSGDGDGEVEDDGEEGCEKPADVSARCLTLNPKP